MNLSTQTGNCLLYSAGLYGFNDAQANRRGRDQLSYGGHRPPAAGSYSAGDVLYQSVEAGDDLYDSRSRCPDELSRGRPVDCRHAVITSSFFGPGGGGSTADLVHQCSDSYCTPSVVRSDCYGFPTSYCGQADFGDCGPTTKQRAEDCAVKDDCRLHQSLTLVDVVPRVCRAVQHHQQPTTHYQQQQQQLARPTTYKWMTIKRGPAKTTSSRFNHIALTRVLCAIFCRFNRRL